MLPFRFCSCFPCSRFRLDLITHSYVPLTFWSVTLITDLCSVYVTHPFVIRRLLATSPLCLSSASRLLYISDVKYKYSACWGDCPSVWISSWILPASSPLFSSVSSAFWQLRPSSDLRLSVLKSSEIRGRRYRKGTAHTLKPKSSTPPHLLCLSSTTLRTYLCSCRSSSEELVLTKSQKICMTKWTFNNMSSDDSINRHSCHSSKAPSSNKNSFHTGMQWLLGSSIASNCSPFILQSLIHPDHFVWCILCHPLNEIGTKVLVTFLCHIMHLHCPIQHRQTKLTIGCSTWPAGIGPSYGTSPCHTSGLM